MNKPADHSVRGEPAQEEVGSRLDFVDCPSCKGFGYEVTGTRKHVRCKHCHDHPSMYAVLDDELLHFGLQISVSGLRERKAHDFFNKVFNFVLLLAFVGGLAALAFSGFRAFQAEEVPFSVLLSPHKLVALFWGGLIIAIFLYYRLDLEKASKKDFDYSEEAKERRKPLKRPANPTWDAYHHLGRSKRHDISQYFTYEAIKAIDDSFGLAKELEHHVITPLHILGALVKSQSVGVILARLGVNVPELYRKMGAAMAKEGLESGSGLDLGLEANRILFYAFEEAKRKRRRRVDVMELLTAIIHQDHWANEIFFDMEIEDKMVADVVEWVHIQKKLRRRYLEWKKKARHKPKGMMDRAMTARPSPLLQSISSDYTAIAGSGGFFPMIGRQKEMDQVLRVLRERTGNVMLVGPPGVGKTTILEGLAELMASEEVPKELQDKRLVVLDPGALIADAKGTGGVEGRINRVIREVLLAGNIVLGIEDIHHLVNMRSGSGSEDVASILMNALSRGQVKVVATTTTQEYKDFISQRGPFIRRFQMVQFEEMSREDAILVLEARSGSAEFKSKVFFSYEALRACVDYTVEFMQDRYLPAKALDMMNEVGSYVQGARGDNQMVSKEDVAQVVADKTNVQVTAITQDERNKLLNMEEIMHERVVGQEEAIAAVASALRRAREGLRDPNRPIANLMFLGPTGVGKTETAKTIAEVYFGNEANMIRLDMSEYQERSSLRKLIGGTGKQGLLTEAIRQKPFSLVLLDELEKAHPDILNLFLQIMDDGRVTDGTGRTFDMTNMMLIATSNAGTQEIQNGLGAGLSLEEVKRRLLETTLQEFYRPEFLNRFDNVVVFTPLTFEQIVEIARRMLEGVARRLLEQKGIALDVESEAIVELAKIGYDPLYGARPMKRAIQDHVDDALAKLLLSDRLGRRDVVVLKAGGVMEVRKARRL